METPAPLQQTIPYYLCDPNAVSTFQEYLLDYASKETCDTGEKLIHKTLNMMDDEVRKIANRLLEKVKSGKRDIYC